ncbi:MAG: polyketide synthase, partial [Candidatus Melainabacteria bacterium HGW-Melainabacteria-1]
MACRFPAAANLEAYWQLLIQGHDAVKPAPIGRWPEGMTPPGGYLEQIDGFDAPFFNLTAQEAAGMDPQQRLLLELSWEVWEDAGLLPSSLAGQAVGVFMGLSSADYTHSQLRDPSQADMYTITGAAASVTANRISYHYDLHGPSLVVDTACSSALTAVHLACESLLNGDCELALAGGVNILLSPMIQAGFGAAMVLSPTGHCQAFGAGADGIVRGEGAGLIVLKPLSLAQADGNRIYALICGTAIGQDGLTNGLSAPSPAGQREVLRRAYARSGVDPSQVNFIEAHGTGTPLGDPIEAKALGEVLGPGRKTPCRLGSVKSNLGHLEAAAGIAGLIKSALALHLRKLPKTLYADMPNPRIPFERWGLTLALDTEDLPADCQAGVSAFGFGGSNAHIVLSSIQFDQASQERQTLETLPQLFALSARTPASLMAGRQQLSQWLERHPETDLFALGHTLARAREPLNCRQAFVAASPAELILDLRHAPEPVRLPSPRPKLAYLYSGMGSQEAGMGQALLGSAAFCTRLEAVDAALRPWLKHSVFDLLSQNQQDPEIVQALLFALQLGLTAHLQALGLQPDAVLGASMGEISAAVVAGMLDLESGARLLCQRIRLLKTRIGTGSLAVVGLSASELDKRLEAEPVWVAAINGPTLCVIAGQDQALSRLLGDFEREGIFVRPVRGATAPSHTPLMAPLGQRLLQDLGDLRPRPGHLPMWSTVQVGLIQGEALDSSYWWQNLSRSVRLYPTLQAMLATS